MLEDPVNGDKADRAEAAGGVPALLQLLLVIYMVILTVIHLK
jgi:hypothetical protein